MAKEAEVEKRRIQEAVSEWEAEKRRRVQDGEATVDDDEDMQDVQVQYKIWRLTSLFRFQGRVVVVLKQIVIPSVNRSGNVSEKFLHA